MYLNGTACILGLLFEFILIYLSIMSEVGLFVVVRVLNNLGVSNVVDGLEAKHLNFVVLENFVTFEWIRLAQAGPQLSQS